MLKSRKKKRLYNLKNDYNSLYILYKYHYHFFHSLINRGNKLWAFNFFINIKYSLKISEKIDPLLVSFPSINNISPQVLLFPYKLGGIVSDVALPISIRKQIIFATKWVIKLLKDNFRILSINQVSSLLLDALYNQGIAIEKKESIHLEAIRNRFLIKFFK